MNEWMTEWIKKWMDEWMNEWMNEWHDHFVGEQLEVWERVGWEDLLKGLQMSGVLYSASYVICSSGKG